MQTARKSKMPLAGAMVVMSALGTAYYVNDFQENEVVQMDQQLRQVATEIDKKTHELTRLRDFAQNIERVKQELRELNLQLESALEHMPRDFNLSGLLKRFTELSQNSGVELASFKPKKSNGSPGENNFYSVIDIDFELRGTYVHTLQFLDQVSRLKRIINVESLRLKAMDTTSTRIGGAVAVTQGTFRTYRFSE